MATKINSMQQLINAVLKPTAKGMSYSVSLAAKKHLKEEIQESVYDRMNPLSYERTRNFLDSVKIEKSTVYSGRIYQNRIVFDYKKIHPQRMAGTWNRHMDVHGIPFHEGNLVQVLEEGTIGSNSLYERNGAWFIYNTKQWLQQMITGYGFTVADVTMMGSDPDSDEPADRVPVGIRIRKRA